MTLKHQQPTSAGVNRVKTLLVPHQLLTNNYQGQSLTVMTRLAGFSQQNTDKTAGKTRHVDPKPATVRGKMYRRNKGEQKKYGYNNYSHLFQNPANQPYAAKTNAAFAIEHSGHDKGA